MRRLLGVLTVSLLLSASPALAGPAWIRQTLQKNFSGVTGEVEVLHFKKNATTPPLPDEGASMFMDTDGTLKAVTVGSDPVGVGGVVPGTLPGGVPVCSGDGRAGDFMQFATTGTNSCQRARMYTDSETGDITVESDLRVKGQIVTDSRASSDDNNVVIQQNTTDVTCANKCQAGQACELHNPSGVYPVCDGTAQVGSNFSGATMFAIDSAGTWASDDDKCARVDQQATAAACTATSTEWIAPADLVVSKWVLGLHDTSIGEALDGEGADIELIDDGTVISTAQYNKAEAWDQNGEMKTLTPNVTVAAGSIVQVRINANAATCETGSGCALPSEETDITSTLFWSLK